MLTKLKTNLIENTNPVGVKKTSNWKLPPKDFAYGKRVEPDKEGVSISKFLFIIIIIVTRSWKEHRPTSAAVPDQDFVRINKMAIKMNATTHATNKDFRHNVWIEKKLPQGHKGKEIRLPPPDFAYGVPNRTPTPIKDVINHAYGNAAEALLNEEYKEFIKERSKKDKLEAKTTNHWRRVMSAKVDRRNVREKPLYKMKMFKNTKSKVAEGVKNFKKFEGENTKFNYHAKHNNKKKDYDDGIDALIDKVENEIKQDNVV